MNHAVSPVIEPPAQNPSHLRDEVTHELGTLLDIGNIDVNAAPWISIVTLQKKDLHRPTLSK